MIDDTDVTMFNWSRLVIHATDYPIVDAVAESQWIYLFKCEWQAIAVNNHT